LSRRGRRGTSRRERGKPTAFWQIIYIDLMTTMMVFFVILWSVDRGGDDTEAGISNTIGDQTVRMVSLPGDVLFSSGRSAVTGEGQKVFQTLFGGDASAVLEFDMGGLARRQLVIHGHTDADGGKDDNFALGYQRAFSIYKEIAKYSDDVPDHVILCTHADNTPTVEVPQVSGSVSAEQRQAIRAAKAKNRRITIEDQVVNAIDAEPDADADADADEPGSEPGADSDAAPAQDPDTASSTDEPTNQGDAGN